MCVDFRANFTDYKEKSRRHTDVPKGISVGHIARIFDAVSSEICRKDVQIIL